jgi:hypothetical protein
LPGDATIRDLLDHPEALAAVISAASRFTDPRFRPIVDEADAARRLKAHLDAPLSELSHALHPRGFASGTEQLAEPLEEALDPYRSAH